MRVILSEHFKDAWRERIAKKKIDTRKITSLIKTAFRKGRVRARTDSKLGVMVIIHWGDKTAYVVGEFNNRKEFVAKTVLNREMASVMGWIKSKSKNLSVTLGEVLKKNGS